MALVKFMATETPVKPPPSGSIEGAAWLAELLRNELHAVLIDPGISTAERRELIIKISKTITQATPNHELYEARKVVREEERELRPSQLRGAVTSAKAPRAGHLRADAPRQRKK